jgi:hypothetical protein
MKRCLGERRTRTNIPGIESEPSESEAEFHAQSFAVEDFYQMFPVLNHAALLVF